MKNNKKLPIICFICGILPTVMISLIIAIIIIIKVFSIPIQDTGSNLGFGLFITILLITVISSITSIIAGITALKRQEQTKMALTTIGIVISSLTLIFIIISGLFIASIPWSKIG